MNSRFEKKMERELKKVYGKEAIFAIRDLLLLQCKIYLPGLDDPLEFTGVQQYISFPSVREIKITVGAENMEPANPLHKAFQEEESIGMEVVFRDDKEERKFTVLKTYKIVNIAVKHSFSTELGYTDIELGLITDPYVDIEIY